MYHYAANIAVDIFILIFFAAGTYYLITAIFSFFSYPRTSTFNERRSFAVVIAAHNEESVIGDLIESIHIARYPQELISIFVVADECSDLTESISRRLGAEIIRRARSVCKGDALKTAFTYLDSLKIKPDIVCVIDADNVVDSYFFEEMNERFNCGAKAVQGYGDSKNPYSSWVSLSHSMWYWLTNRIMQGGRSNLGLGCRLSGTGFAIRYDTLEKIGWNTVTVAEDIEYTCILAEHDIKVEYAGNAVVYDEKPATMIESIRQRCRWAKGISEVQGMYSARLFFRGRLGALLGLWCDTLYPLCFFVLTVVMIFKAGGIAKSIIGECALLLFAGLNMIVALVSLYKDKKLNTKVILNLFGFIIYIVSWLPIWIFGIFGFGGGWYHTNHKSK